MVFYFIFFIFGKPFSLVLKMFFCVLYSSEMLKVYLNYIFITLRNFLMISRCVISFAFSIYIQSMLTLHLDIFQYVIWKENENVLL